MLSEGFEKKFSGVVPIFPLPNVVLFPGTRLPLHIFEPRYQQMLHDVRNTERLISIVLLDRTSSKFDKSNPPVHSVAGLGRLTRVEKLPNGLFNIDLFGISRVEILEELSTEKPYRMAKVKTLKEPPSDLSESKAEDALQRAFDAFNRVLRKYSRFPGEFLTRFRTLPLGILLDIIAHHMPCDAGRKQGILEEIDPLKRCEKIVEVLDAIYNGPEPSKRVSALSLFPKPSTN